MGTSPILPAEAGKGGICMPAAITHTYHARRVLELSREEQWDRDAFLWGAQGPDFLLYHRALPWQKGESLSQYGNCLHQEPPAPVFRFLREYAAAHPTPAVRSYAAGFLCHYAMDRTCHPFVHAQAQKLLQVEPEQDLAIAHNRVESALDVIVLRYEAGALPIEFDLKKTLPKKEALQKELVELYTFLLERLFGLSNTSAAVTQAMADARCALGWLNDRTSLKKAFVERWEKKHGGKHTLSCYMHGVSEGDAFDYANTLLDGWRWPPENGTERHESFFDLYERSIEDAMALKRGFFAERDLKALTDDRPFE